MELCSIPWCVFGLGQVCEDSWNFVAFRGVCLV